MATDKKLSLGSWSEGSTRTEDIADAALDMAESVQVFLNEGHVGYRAAVDCADALDSFTGADESEGVRADITDLQDALDTLIDALDECDLGRDNEDCYVEAGEEHAAIVAARDAIRKARGE